MWGETVNVSISKKAIKGNTLTHNHVSGGTLSEDDIFRFSLFEAHEFRATTPTGITYSIRTGEGGGDNRIADDYNSVAKRIKDEAQTYAKQNSNSIEERNMIYSNMVKEKLNDWLVANVSKYGYVYTMEKRGI
jgi:hypothetical protein